MGRFGAALAFNQLLRTAPVSLLPIPLLKRHAKRDLTRRDQINEECNRGLDFLVIAVVVATCLIPKLGATILCPLHIRLAIDAQMQLYRRFAVLSDPLRSQRYSQFTQD